MIKAKYPINLPPTAAIEYFKEKGNIFSWDWFDTWQEAHSKAFTVAKVTRMDVLTDIRNMVEKSIKEGITFQQFQKELTPKLKAKGWWGKQEIDGKEVQLGSPWRLKTIYQTNLKTAYSAGRYKAMIDNKENRPYWQYRTREDPKVRDEHKVLDKKVFRYDDELWNHFYPPNGWRCRCYVIALKKRDIKKEGLKVLSSDGNIHEENMPVGRNTGIEKPVAVYVDPVTGKKTVITAPGWNYNPGRAKWEPELSKYADDLIEQYKKDINTNTKIARVIDQDIRKDMKNYFGVNIELKEEPYFCQTEEEFKEKCKEVGLKTTDAAGFYHDGKIVYSNEVINNSRTGTILNGINTITHEYIHAIGKFEYENWGDEDFEVNRFLEEGLTELLSRKFLVDKYGVKTNEISFGTYQPICADMLIQLIIKYDFNKESVWKELKEMRLSQNDSAKEKFKQTFTYYTHNINQSLYNSLIKKIKNKQLFTWKDEEELLQEKIERLKKEAGISNEVFSDKEIKDLIIVDENDKIERQYGVEEGMIKWIMQLK